MISRSALCELIEPLIQSQGLELFDVDLPSAKSGVLRVFIRRNAPQSETQSQSELKTEAGDEAKAEKVAEEGKGRGVTLDDCAAVSKALSLLPGFEEMLPAQVTLEVSSPGVNRRLRTEQHFQGAVGEHISVKHTNSENKRVVLKGTLIEFDGVHLKLQEDGSDEITRIPYANIDDARVEFLFQ